MVTAYNVGAKEPLLVKFTRKWAYSPHILLLVFGINPAFDGVDDATYGWLSPKTYADL